MYITGIEITFTRICTVALLQAIVVDFAGETYSAEILFLAFCSNFVRSSYSLLFLTETARASYHSFTKAVTIPVNSTERSQTRKEVFRIFLRNSF